VLADVVRRRRLDLSERRVAAGADADTDPVADGELARRDELGHAARPLDEHRAPAVGERLVLSLTEHRLERAVVSVHDVDAEMAVDRGRVERSLEEPERLAGPAWVRAVICDDLGRRRFDLRERRAALGANADDELIALGQVAQLHDGRNAVSPTQVLGVRTDRKCLPGRLADHQAQRALVAAGHVHEQRGGVRRWSRRKLTSELVLDETLLAGRDRAGRSEADCGDGRQSEEDHAEPHVHPPWT
jgi:hypothetical protein